MDSVNAMDAEGVTVRARESTLLNSVSLTAAVGEITALLGPNGAGKSTLLRVCAGTLPLEQGQVRLFGEPLAQQGWAALARRRAVLPQSSTLQFPFPVAEVIALGFPDQDRARHRRDIAELLRAVDLTGWEDRLYPTLSGGEQQRVQFARILAQTRHDSRPFLLLLDEPVAQLDLRHQHGLFGILRRMSEDRCAVVVVIHDLNLALRYADRAVLLDRGSLVGAGTPANVLRPDVVRRVFGVESHLDETHDGHRFLFHSPVRNHEADPR